MEALIDPDTYCINSLGVGPTKLFDNCREANNFENLGKKKQKKLVEPKMKKKLERKKIVK